MASFRAWLFSFFLATSFAVGVVAIVLCDPRAMLDEEDQHGEKVEDVDAEFVSDVPGSLHLASDSDSLDDHAAADASSQPCANSDAPTLEYRLVLHRPPAA